MDRLDQRIRKLVDPELNRIYEEFREGGSLGCDLRPVMSRLGIAQATLQQISNISTEINNFISINIMPMQNIAKQLKDMEEEEKKREQDNLRKLEDENFWLKQTLSEMRKALYGSEVLSLKYMMPGQNIVSRLNRRLDDLEKKIGENDPEIAQLVKDTAKIIRLLKDNAKDEDKVKIINSLDKIIEGQAKLKQIKDNASKTLEACDEVKSAVQRLYTATQSMLQPLRIAQDVIREEIRNIISEMSSLSGDVSNLKDAITTDLATLSNLIDQLGNQLSVCCNNLNRVVNDRADNVDDGLDYLKGSLDEFIPDSLAKLQGISTLLASSAPVTQSNNILDVLQRLKATQADVGQLRGLL